MKIALAITTHNRYEVFKKSYSMWKKFLPKGAKLYVVDDGSDIPVPEATFRFAKPQGISVAKNKCFELMGEADFYFQVDDDIYPLHKDWYKPYINSGMNHLCLGFDRFSNGGRNGHVLVKSEGGFDYWQEPCGLMMMFTKKCLETVGGMDTRYKTWGSEHVQLSRRIFNAGLTPYPYMDIKDSIKNFYSYDQDQSSPRSLDEQTRRIAFSVNQQLLHQDFNSKAYCPIIVPEDVYITTLFTKIVDPQREEKWKADKSVLDVLIKSLDGQKLIVLTDTFENSVENNVHYIKVKTSSNNPYWQRWLSIAEHLTDNKYGKIMICDGTDVTLMRDPFPHLLPNIIYLGDEQGQIIRNRWLMDRHPAQVYQKMYDIGASWRLLNAGLCGGLYDTVKKFVDLMVLHYHEHGKTDYTDMPGFNYIAYLHFKDKIFHGPQMNNIFKSFADNNICWFLHK